MWQRPTAETVMRAIDAYIASVYAGDPPPPLGVRDRIAKLRAAPAETFYDSPVFERDDPTTPTKYFVRLGNRLYPHMKLVVERSPDGAGHLFRADTHDKHIRPQPGSRDYVAFCELISVNQRAAQQVEAEWDRLGLPTFKRYLREDLARRAAAAAAAQQQPPTTPT